MKLVIYVNEHAEDERALFDKNEGKIIMKGDYYHDKIDQRIEGYLEALSDFSIYKEEVGAEYIDESHELYEKIGFYNENEDM